MTPTQEDREREPFRWCVHCDADCEVDEPQHTPQCPQNTGLHHVRYESMHQPCEHCGKRPSPAIRCSECDCVLDLGDPYTHREIGEQIYEPICLGCAAVGELNPS